MSTGANIVDQDFFEGLGFRHYIAPGSPEAPPVDDMTLRNWMIDRIYDTYIDEDDLRACDAKTHEIFNAFEPGAYSSREFIHAMGSYLAKYHAKNESIVKTAYLKKVPIFVPAFSDCSAGFGIVLQQTEAIEEGRGQVAFDSGKDFRELTDIKLACKDTGLLMLGGGVPKNFAQDIVVAAELLNERKGGKARGDIGMHKYAIQMTVADSRDAAHSRAARCARRAVGARSTWCTSRWCSGREGKKGSGWGGGGGREGKKKGRGGRWPGWEGGERGGGEGGGGGGGEWQGMQNGHISPDGRVQLWRVVGKSPGWMVLSVGVAVRSEIDSEGIHRAVGFGGRPPGLPFAVKNSARSVPMPRSPANASSVYFFGWPWRSMWSSYEEKWDYDVVSGGSHRACRVIRSAGPRDAFMRLPRTPVGLAVPTGVLWRGFVAGTAVWATAWWVLLVTPWLVRRAWRARRGRCVWCGYDCRAVPVASPCPECGTARPIVGPVG